MGRKRLLAVLASAALTIGAFAAPVAALDAAGVTTAEAAAEDDATVELPVGLGEVDVEVEDDAVVVDATIDLREPTGTVDVEPALNAEVSSTPDVSVEAPTKLGSLEADPIGDLLGQADQALAPVLDVVAPTPPSAPAPDAQPASSPPAGEAPDAAPAAPVSAAPSTSPRSTANPLAGPRKPVNLRAFDGGAGAAGFATAFDQWDLEAPEVALPLTGDGLLAAGPYDTSGTRGDLDDLIRALAVALLLLTTTLTGLVGQRSGLAHRPS